MNKGTKSTKRQQEQKESDGLEEKVIKINRVTKVVKGGKRLGFRAVVIVGDYEGNVGIGVARSKEVPAAIQKASVRAKKDLESINVVGGTIPHEVVGKSGSAQVILRPAKSGTGVIAGGSVRILLELLGLKDVVAKSIGASNTINVAKAAMDGLLQLKDLKNEEEIRGKKLPVYFEK